jgi:hypothetical protein
VGGHLLDARLPIVVGFFRGHPRSPPNPVCPLMCCLPPKNAVTVEKSKLPTGHLGVQMDG